MPFPVDAKFVAQTEAKLGVRFPLGYVAQMLTSNGGSVAAGGDHWFLYPIFDDSDKKRLKRTCNDVVRETRQLAQWETFPHGAIAIGNNGGGDQLILLRKQGDSRLGDEVFWWDHETGDVLSVANDFADLKKYK